MLGEGERLSCPLLGHRFQFTLESIFFEHSSAQLFELFSMRQQVCIQHVAKSQPITGEGQREGAGDSGNVFPVAVLHSCMSQALQQGHQAHQIFNHSTTILVGRPIAKSFRHGSTCRLKLRNLRGHLVEGGNCCCPEQRTTLLHRF